ncbi:aminoacyl-tRNA hydrolase [Candidatus Parcubacteria bacterium]|nr:aminoacyl-tRNA hydrolase [Candidatus Parcubacteria bacterium]
MILIAALGNPGDKFEKTRHNLGFRIINAFREKNSFFDFKLEKKFNSLVSEGFLDEEKIVLAKPQTFMNSSGQAIRKLVSYYNIPLANLWIVHDDLDLPLGKIKIASDRGPAGHNGVKSIINELKTENFLRFRIGIASKLVCNAEDFVLKKFSKEEEKIVGETLAKTTQAIESALTEGIDQAMNEYNQ